MERETRFSPPAVGGSSLLVIFSVLVLCVFALLSLSTVLSEKRLADASAQAASDYYGAELQAEQIFARLRGGEVPPQVQETGGTYRYSCPISQGRQLEVELTCTEGVWKILRWQTVSSPESAADDTLTVWDGSIPEEGSHD